MTTPLVVFGDAEDLVCEVLQDRTGAGEPLEGAFVGTELPEDLADHLPAIRVRRFGGVPTNKFRFDAPRLDVEAWAPTKAGAHDLIQTARGVLVQAQGSRKPQGYIGEVRDEGGVSWRPDEVTGTPRYLYTVQLVTNP